MFQREIKLPKNLSFFLFGARGTGKSTLLADSLDAKFTCVFNLLQRDIEDQLLADPMSFHRQVLALPKEISTVVVDEIQKIPSLLDSVHNLIDTHKVPQRFVLTGSSARKLKAGAANLLGGRAAVRHLFPLTSQEIGAAFDLDTALSYGTLPKIWNTSDEDEKKELLRAYASVYLKEEVWAEQLVRKLEPFRRFLEVAARHSGKIINATSIASDAGTNDKSVQNWYGVLEDTLLGFHLEPFHASVRKQLKQSPKFYFFDTGVVRALAGHLTIPVLPKTSYYGELFEAFVISQLRARCHYCQNDFKLHYLCTKSNVEVDLVIVRPGKELAFVEIKSTDKVHEKHFSTLVSFLKDFPTAEFLLLSTDRTPQLFGKIRALHWREGINYLLS